ncbi:flagellar biosynthetic protein FliR [Parvularcula dongshanensis]|uniref:Flagellar biosynthetic protein FliR n=1 Tax=Parvularcula dongshanensis TaxID=1173995 RepID=A0A840I3R7_9PROT|nr:flagellar biosynthetic protein FliR [Parvularcula dongshanensis]
MTGVLGAFVIAALAVFTRLSLMMFLLPGIGERAVPVRVRLITALALMGAILPVVLPASAARADTPILVLIAGEALIGFGLGFSFRVMIHALTIAGVIIAQAINLSQILGAAVTEEATPAVSTLLTLVGAALFVTLDLHVQAVRLLADSYAVFPLGGVPATDGLGEWAMSRTADAFALSVSIALPFVLIGFLYNVVLGLINQAMPQMMVTFVGVPANVLAGLFLLSLCLGAMMTAWLGAMDEAPLGFW